MKNVIAYYRVSTNKQGVDGLGIQAQETSVLNFCKGKYIINQSFTEVESGKNNNRIELLKAIQLCKEENYTLIIAKLDRLSRNAAFIMNLKESKINFIACDMPEANTMTIGIMAVMAQHEREMISNRTKAALTELKKQGKILGNAGKYLTDEGRRKAANNKRIEALVKNNSVLTIISLMKDKKLKEIAEYLNNKGFKTSKNKEFSTGTIQYLLKLI